MPKANNSNGNSSAAIPTGPALFTTQEAHFARLRHLKATDRLAYEFTLGDDRDTERALRAVGILLEYSSQDGNENVSGWLAFGLNSALRGIADRLAMETRERQKEEDAHAE
jgi:hypothetical protein